MTIDAFQLLQIILSMTGLASGMSSVNFDQYYSNGVKRRCNKLVGIIRHLNKANVLYYATQLHMRYEHLPLFTHSIPKSPIRMPCFKAASSSAIG